MPNNNLTPKELADLFGDLLRKSHQLKEGHAITAGGPGADVVIQVKGVKTTTRAKAVNKIEAGKPVLAVYSPADKITLAINQTGSDPGRSLRIEQSEKKRPPKPPEKKETAIVPILVSKTVGEELEQKPECTCTHYAIGKVTGSRPFSYETCDGTVPGAAKTKEDAEKGEGISKIYYWCFNSWNINSSIPWLPNSLPLCEEPFIPRHPDLFFYGSRTQTFKLNPSQQNYEPRTLPYTASNMYLLEIGPIAAYFENEDLDPLSIELFLYPDVQENIWGFHLVADEQEILTATGRKYAIRPTTISGVPVLTPPITALASATAWLHPQSNAFGGVVRVVIPSNLNSNNENNSGESTDDESDMDNGTSNAALNFNGWLVAFGDPIDCWYDENDNRVPDGTGSKREIGVVLRSLGFWNRVPWQLVIDPDTCPVNPKIENLLNGLPTDPQDPSKYLMTKWFVGGITEQWLELPVKHRADDPHFGMISCNSEKNKIWVAIKTGLDPLNTYDEKAKWFLEPDGMVDNFSAKSGYPYYLKEGNKIGIGRKNNVENNYLYPDDKTKPIPFENEEAILSERRSQFANEGGRFCKIKLIEINIANNGDLSIHSEQSASYETESSLQINSDNWKSLEMNSFLAYLGGVNSIDDIDDEPGIIPLHKIFSASPLNNVYENPFLYIANTTIPGALRKNNVFISAISSFFGLVSHYYEPEIQLKSKISKDWNNYYHLKLSQQPKKNIITSYGLFCGLNSILFENRSLEDIGTSSYTSTVITIENPILFNATHILGVSDKPNAIKEIDRWTKLPDPFPVDYPTDLIKGRKEMFFKRRFGIINYYTQYTIPIPGSIVEILGNKYSFYWPFWNKEELNSLINEKVIFRSDQLKAKNNLAKEKSLKFFKKNTTIYESFPDNHYLNAVIFTNLSKGKLCCFDFKRGYKLKGSSLEGFDPSLYNELAFSDKPVECPVYVCDFDSNDELVNYNIYAGKVANALVYPFDYTEGEPCSFTVWGAAPALMKLKKE